MRGSIMCPESTKGARNKFFIVMTVPISNQEGAVSLFLMDNLPIVWPAQQLYERKLIGI